jgi:hypothetical protein
MLRHGRLKHKTNLGKQPRPSPAPAPPTPVATSESAMHHPESSATTASASPETFQALPLLADSIMPQHGESATAIDSVINIDPSLQLDPCFASLDPALYAPLPFSDPFSDIITPDMFLEHLAAFTIPSPETLLTQNGFRDTLIKAAQSMPCPPTIPSNTSLNRYLSLFIEKFLPHSPFLPPSFNSEMANPLLLTAMASIGALYSVERKTALLLHAVGKNLEENLRGAIGCDDYPLWAVQSLYLNTVCRCF